MMADVESKKQAESAKRIAQSLQGLVDDPKLKQVLSDFDGHANGILEKGLKDACWNLACQDRAGER